MKQFQFLIGLKSIWNLGNYSLNLDSYNWNFDESVHYKVQRKAFICSMYHEIDSKTGHVTSRDNEQSRIAQNLISTSLSSIFLNQNAILYLIFLKLWLFKYNVFHKGIVFFTVIWQYNRYVTSMWQLCNKYVTVVLPIWNSYITN